MTTTTTLVLPILPSFFVTNYKGLEFVYVIQPAHYVTNRYSNTN